jgi:hypothetical protein
VLLGRSKDTGKEEAWPFSALVDVPGVDGSPESAWMAWLRSRVSRSKQWCDTLRIVDTDLRFLRTFCHVSNTTAGGARVYE